MCLLEMVTETLALIFLVCPNYNVSLLNCPLNQYNIFSSIKLDLSALEDKYCHSGINSYFQMAK